MLILTLEWVVDCVHLQIKTAGILVSLLYLLTLHYILTVHLWFKSPNISTYIFHDPINTSYFNLIVFYSSCFQFWDRMPQHHIGIQKKYPWFPTSYYKTKVKGKHQNNVQWTRLVCNRKVGKPTLVNRLFFATLVISGTVTVYSIQC